MKVIHGSYPSDNEKAELKTCPVCGAVCFEDMDVCFGCLHQFNENEAQMSARERNPFNALSDAQPATEKTTVLDQAAQHKAISPQGMLNPSEQSPRSHPINTGQEPTMVLIEKSSNAENTNVAGQEATTKHVCIDEQGRTFEIAISIKVI